MTLRAMFVACAAAAAAVGCLLPAARHQIEPASQIEQLEVQR